MDPNPNPMYLSPENNKKLDIGELMFALEVLEKAQQDEASAQMIDIPMEGEEAAEEQRRLEQQAREARRQERRAQRRRRLVALHGRIRWFFVGLWHAEKDVIPVIAMCMVVALLIYLIWFV